MPKRGAKARSRRSQVQDDDDALKDNGGVPIGSQSEACSKENTPIRSSEAAPSSQNPTQADDAQIEEELSLDTEVVFQCGSCRSIIGDTLSDYDAHFESNSISLKAARNVEVDDKMQMSREGFDAGCTYKEVKCSYCSHVIGRVYSSTTPALDARRSTYTLDTSALVSYQLGSCRDLDGKLIAITPRDRRRGETILQAASEGTNKAFVPVEAFDALDVHVSSLTELTAQTQNAITQVRELSDVNRQSITDLKVSLEQSQNIMLLWEERFERLGACEKQIEVVEKRVEYFTSMEEQLVSFVERLTRLEGSLSGTKILPTAQSAQPGTQQFAARPPVRLKSSPSISKSARSPARTPLRRNALQDDSPFAKRRR